MQKSFDVLFASSNKHKYIEAREILKSFGINLGFFKANLQEIQSHDIREIAATKSKDAFSKCKLPVIVEDDGLFIDVLRGFPGVYSSYVFKTIGNKGILNLLSLKRTASFQSVIAFTNKHDTILFSGKVLGKISKKSQGNGWGYDPIFIPNNSLKTFACIDKNNISHRYKALKKFAKWFDTL